jgi:hypothetical protein
MNHSSLVDVVVRSLKNGPVTLDDLMTEHASMWHRLRWESAQVSLWLACSCHVSQERMTDGELRYSLANEKTPVATRLADELVALLQKTGHPVPLMQLIRKLPPGVVVTEPMLRTAAQQDDRLELKGPLLKLA